jgi:flagellar basal-body rod modification protein FlgD
MQLSLGTLVDSLRSSQMLGGAALIGRQVLAPAEAIDHVAGTTVQGAVQLPDGTSAASVQIRDSAGQLVGRFELPASSGLQPFTWNGMTTTGEVAKGGRYSIEVVARVGADSESVPVQIVDEVRSVSLDPATQEITVNTAMLGSVPLSQVQQIG